MNQYKAKVAWYTYKGQEVVIMYEDDAKECGIYDSAVDHCCDRCLIPLDIASKHPEVDVCSTLTDSYEGDNSIGEEIDSEWVTCYENNQRLVDVYETVALIKRDEFHREFCVHTDSYYDWHSQVEKCYDALWNIYADNPTDDHIDDMVAEVRSEYNSAVRDALSAIDNAELRQELAGTEISFDEILKDVLTRI